jgi:hypothetical protein
VAEHLPSKCEVLISNPSKKKIKTHIALRGVATSPIVSVIFYYIALKKCPWELKASSPWFKSAVCKEF